MAILFGEDGRKTQRPQPCTFGKRMGTTAHMPLEGAFDIALDEAGKTAFIAAKGGMDVVDVHRPQRPQLLARLDLEGDGRQIAYQHGIACITARQDGLFICDVSDPAQPRQLAHYDTVELATGVCISGSFCFVTCRHMGVEIIDISVPGQPRHVANVLAGEAQSVYVGSSLMLVGAWVERQVIVFDVSDIAKPRKLSVCELDGYADGLCMRGDICYVATGHHARRLTNRVKYEKAEFVTTEMLEDGYGCGHGLELFDLSDPENPRFLSRVKAPPFFYSGQDMWSVCLWGNTAYLASTWMGVFAINVANALHPQIVGHYRLHPVAMQEYCTQPFIQQLCAPVNGIAAASGQLYAVSTLEGFYVLDSLSIRQESEGDDAERWQHVPEGMALPPPGEGTRVFHPPGQVHGVAFDEPYVVVAAGGDGLYLLNRQKAWQVEQHIATQGFAMDVARQGDAFLVAEGRGGLSIYRLVEGALVLAANTAFSAPVRQVVAYPRQIAAVQLGVDSVAFMHMETPQKPEILSVHSELGMMYYKNIVRGLYEDRFAIAVPLAPKTIYFDLEDPGDIRRIDTAPERIMCPLEDGIAVQGKERLTLMEGGYTIHGKCTQPVYIEDMEMRGWPFLHNGRLYLIDRRVGQLTIVEIRQNGSPQCIRTIDQLGHPESIVWHEGSAYLPCGHWGLVAMEEK